MNSFPAVNTLYNALLQHPDFGKIDWSMLKSAIAGGMAVQKSVAEAWMKATGRPIIEGYGLSETSPVLTCNRGDIAEWTGTIGLPMPSTEISIRDDDGHDVPIGEQGEICARGPQVMPGYWKRPDETAKVMTADGFFRTGDIGVMDADGRVKIVDRKKDMISVSGFKVFPNEVEDVAMMQGGVVECAAVGVPDAHSGEAVKLFAVKKSPDLTEQDLRKYMHSELAGYKVPKQIEFRNELPKTNVGKILRRALRDDDMNDARRAALARRRGRVLARGRTEAWFEKDAAFDDEIRRRFLKAHEAAAAGKLNGWEAKRGGRAGAAHPARSISAQHVPWSARAFATDSPRARSPPAPWCAVSTVRCRPTARLLLSAVRAFGRSRRPGARHRALQGGRRCRRPEMGEGARRHHPPLRPLPAPQCGARPRHHAGGQKFLDDGGFAG